jgi:hypothetical protein
MITDAAIDVHASLRLYEALVPALADLATRVNCKIPSAWYTFNARYGFPMKTRKIYWDRDTPWSITDCTWFYGGKFQGHV